jgi:hypothetical protein
MKFGKYLGIAIGIVLSLSAMASAYERELRFGPWAYYAPYYFPPFVYDACFMPPDAFMSKYETPPPPMPKWDPGKRAYDPPPPMNKRMKRRAPVNMGAEMMGGAPMSAENSAMRPMQSTGRNLSRPRPASGGQRMGSMTSEPDIQVIR